MKLKEFWYFWGRSGLRRRLVVAQSQRPCKPNIPNPQTSQPFWHRRTRCKEIWRSQCRLLWGFATSPPYIEHSCCAIWCYSLIFSKENVWTSAEHGAGYSATVILHPWNEEASNPEWRYVSHGLCVGLEGSCKLMLTWSYYDGFCTDA